MKNILLYKASDKEKSRVVVYDKGPRTTKSYDSLITWPGEITWQIKKFYIHFFKAHDHQIWEGVTFDEELYSP